MTDSFIKRGPSKLEVLREELARMESELDYFIQGGAAESQIYHIRNSIEKIKEQIQEEESKQWQKGQQNMDEKLKMLAAQNQQITPEMLAKKQGRAQ